jgi:hypothetical protein
VKAGRLWLIDNHPTPVTAASSVNPAKGAMVQWRPRHGRWLECASAPAPCPAQPFHHQTIRSFDHRAIAHSNPTDVRRLPTQVTPIPALEWFRGAVTFGVGAQRYVSFWGYNGHRQLPAQIACDVIDPLRSLAGPKSRTAVSP